MLTRPTNDTTSGLCGIQEGFIVRHVGIVGIGMSVECQDICNGIQRTTLKHIIRELWIGLNVVNQFRFDGIEI